MNEVRQPLAEKQLTTGGLPLVEIASRPGNGEVQLHPPLKRWNWRHGLYSPILKIGCQS